MANMVNITSLEDGKRTVSLARNIRFVVMLNEQEDKEIQAYRFSRQIGTKSEAMRILIRKGLETEKTATTGVEFGDLSPAVAENHNTRKECCDAADI